MLTEEELLTLTALAYVAGVAAHFLLPELRWLGGIFGQSELTALLVLLFGSAAYYGYGAIAVALAYGVHTAGRYSVLQSLAGLDELLQSIMAGNATRLQMAEALPEYGELIAAAVLLALTVLQCASAAAFGMHLHTRSPRAALGLVVFAVTAYSVHLIGV